MQTYSCKVRLANSVQNEVRRNGVLAAEIILMRLIHGETAVLEVRPEGESKLTQLDARDRIMRDYVTGSPEISKIVNQVFPGFTLGASDLPTRLSSVDLVEEEPRRQMTGKVAKRADAADEAA